MRASAEETSLHPHWLGHYLSAALQAISQHRISGTLQRHRMTDAGMRLDRAGGGAASGEGERLPGMALLIPASGRNCGLFLSRKKERSNRNLESCRRPAAAREKTMGTRRTSRLQKREYMDEMNEKYRQRELKRQKQQSDDIKEREY